MTAPRGSRSREQALGHPPMHKLAQTDEHLFPRIDLSRLDSTFWNQCEADAEQMREALKNAEEVTQEDLRREFTV